MEEWGLRSSGNNNISIKNIDQNKVPHLQPPMNLLFLDTETTDLIPSARLIQLAYKLTATGEEFNEYFKPPVPISYGAMSVHHVTNEMVADKPAFEGSEAQSKLITLLANNIPVAHNAPFDINILKNEGVEIDKYIDTLRVARHLISSEQYKLQYLRYFLKLDVEGPAHDAMGDVLVLEALFDYLLPLLKEKFVLESDDDIVAKLLELTQTPVMLEAFSFGKYTGKTFKEVSEIDKGYLHWLHGSETEKEKTEQNEDMVYTLEYFLR